MLPVRLSSSRSNDSNTTVERGVFLRHADTFAMECTVQLRDHPFAIAPDSLKVLLVRQTTVCTSAAPPFAWTRVAFFRATSCFSFITLERTSTEHLRKSPIDHPISGLKNSTMALPTSDHKSASSSSLPVQLATAAENITSASNDASQPSTVDHGAAIVSYTPNFTVVDTISANTAPNKKCANFAGPGTHQCARCADGVDQYGKHSKVFYCGAKYSREHWTPRTGRSASLPSNADSSTGSALSFNRHSIKSERRCGMMRSRKPRRLDKTLKGAVLCSWYGADRRMMSTNFQRSQSRSLAKNGISKLSWPMPRRPWPS